MGALHFSFTSLKNFKNNALNSIKLANPDKKIIGYADSPSDIPFLKQCDEGFLIIKNRIQRI